MHPFDEMKRWVGFSDDDANVLDDIRVYLEPEVVPIIDHFYEKILESDGARAVLADEDQVLRLKKTLRRWLVELLRGPHDADYYERRERIGRRHVDVGLHSRYMFTAMSVMQDDLTRIIVDAVPPNRQQASIRAVQRICSLDLAIMTGTYVESRERQQLATLQSMLVDNLTVSVLLVDTDHNVVAATHPSSRMFTGVATLGRPWTTVLPQDLLVAADLEAHVLRALDTGHDISLFRVDVGSADKARSFRIHVAPLGHEHAAFMLQIEELTEVVRMESRLRRAEALAQLGSMSAAVAHELRNPLAGISGAVQVIANSLPEDAPHRPIMLKVREEIHRLDRLVNDLLSFARPTRVELKPIQLRTVVDGVCDLIRSDRPQARIEVVGTSSAQGDSAALHGVVLNLVQNGLQATEGTGTVRVTLADHCVTVDDDGPGVPVESRREIFEPFVTTKTRGTGLGLAISQRYAAAMQGHLTVTDSPLGGARFALTLPPPTPG